MPQRFEATERAIQNGLSGTDPKEAVRLIEGWEGELDGVDRPGVEEVRADLTRLKEELGKGTPDAAAVVEIMGRLGEATNALAEEVDDEEVADKLHDLGDALEDTADLDDVDEED